jgi:galactonate dehydratase
MGTASPDDSDITSARQLGERLFTRQDVRPYFESGCIDIIQPDISHAGGISETRRIANMAE